MDRKPVSLRNDTPFHWASTFLGGTSWNGTSPMEQKKIDNTGPSVIC